MIDKEVLTAASKVLYLIHLMKYEGKEINKYSKNQQLENADIPTEYKKRIKVIKKLNEEAYYYIIESMK